MPLLPFGSAPESFKRSTTQTLSSSGVYVPGIIGQSVTIPAHTSLETTYYSVRFWVKASPATTASGMLCVKTTGTDPLAPYQILRNSSNSNLLYRMSNGASYVTMVGTKVVFDNLWHYVALRWDGTTWKATVDNVTDVTSTPTGIPASGAGQPITLGQRGGAFLAIASFDEFKLSNTYVSDAQLTAEYNGGLGLYGVDSTDLVCGLHFDEATGTTSADYSGTGNNANIVSPATWGDGRIESAVSTSSQLTAITFANGDEANEIGDIKLGDITGTTTIQGKKVLVRQNAATVLSFNTNGQAGFGTSNPIAQLTTNATSTSNAFSVKVNDAEVWAVDTTGRLRATTSLILTNTGGTNVLSVAGGGVAILGAFLDCQGGGIQLPGGASYANGIFTSGWASSISINDGMVVLGSKANNVKILAKAHTSQTVDLYQLQNSSGVILTAFDKDGKLVFGPSGSQDTNLYRSAANTLKTDDSLIANNYASALSTKTADYTITASDSIILADTTTASFTVTLPTAVGITGRSYTIKKLSGGINGVTIDGNGSETIDGSLSITITTQWTVRQITSDGANWVVTGGLGSL